MRLYEELALISKPQRRPNGYRVFTEAHRAQLQLARTALRVEVLQSGLRREAVDIAKTAAKGDYEAALREALQYLAHIREERRKAEESLAIARGMLSGAGQCPQGAALSRKEAAEALDVTMDTLRNWELNGLFTVKRRRNGYRVYSAGDMQTLKIIRTLRSGGYSLSAILRLLETLRRDPGTDIRLVIDTPGEGEDIISVCDRLLTSLNEAEQVGETIRRQVAAMKKANPPL